MIITENLKIRDRNFIKTYSDQGFYIEREKNFYEEAIDPVGSRRDYYETDIKIRECEE